MRITASARSLSRGAVGSSARITGGRLTSARAMDTRCCSPPESCDIMALARCATSSASSSSSASFPGLGIGLPGQHGQQCDIVGDIEKRNQVGGLKHETDLVAAQGPQIWDLPAVVINDFVSQRHAPGCGFDHSAQAFEQGALARSGGADQSHDLAGKHPHVHALEGIDRGVALAVALANGLDVNAFFSHISRRSPRPGPP